MRSLTLYKTFLLIIALGLCPVSALAADVSSRDTAGAAEGRLRRGRFEEQGRPARPPTPALI